MRMLERSARDNGFRFVALPEHHAKSRMNTIDKVRLLTAYLNTGALAATDIVMFTDAYDVLVTEHCSLIHERFLAFDADVVVNAEANFFPGEILEHKAFFDKQLSKWRYLNSGCFIGYAWAVSKMMSYINQSIPATGAHEHCMDQLLMQQFYIQAAASHRVRICLDMATSIFAPLFLTEQDFVLERYGVRNTVTGRSPCVLHANGFKHNMNVLHVIDGMAGHAPMYLSLACAGEALLGFDHDRRRLTVLGQEDPVMLLVHGDRAFAFTASAPILTFERELAVHADAEDVGEWETLLVASARLTSDHSVPIERYIDGLGDERVRLAPVPLTVLAQASPQKLLGAVSYIAERI